MYPSPDIGDIFALCISIIAITDSEIMTTDLRNPRHYFLMKNVPRTRCMPDPSITTGVVMDFGKFGDDDETSPTKILIFFHFFHYY